MDTIGNMLYTERRKKGLEIVDIEQATGIRGIYLHALEQGKYEILPGEVYVKGFIRNYANYLELDGAHLVQLYTNSIAPAAVSPTVLPAQAQTGAKAASVNRRSFNKKTISTVIVILILVVSAWSLYAWQKNQPVKNTATVQETAVNKAAVSSTAQPTPANYPVGPTATTPPIGSRPVVLSARFSDRCWTSVIADGKTLYEGIPKNGEMFTWEADRQIVVNFGNAAAVELTFNGQPVGKIGERGDVVVKTFTAQGLTAAPVAPATPATPAVPITPAAPTAPTTPAVPGSPGGNR